MKIAAALLASMLALGAAAAAPAGASGVAKPRVGGTVIVGGVEPACLNLLMFETCSAGLVPPFLTVVNQVLEGAYEIGPDLTYRPNLVSTVRLTKRPFTVTYVIRPEARWSDGVPVSAADFVFTHEVLSDQKLDFAYPEDVKDRILSVRATGPKTVRVRFTGPYGPWRDLFYWVFPRHALAGRDLRTIWRDAIEDPRTAQPIGSGPFLTQRLERGGELTLVRNRRYWRPHKPYLDRVVFRFIPASQAAYIDALRTGRVDLVNPQVQPELAQLRRERGLTVRSTVGLVFESIGIRVGPKGGPALKRPFVRRALISAIDRNALVRQLFASTHPRLQPLENAIFMSNSRFYRPHWNIYNRKSKGVPGMLERRGCRRGLDGIYMCGGQRLSFRFVTTAGNPLRQEIARAVQVQLRKVGIEIVPTFAPPRVLIDVIGPSGDFDLVLAADISQPDPANLIPLYACGGHDNVFGYCNRRVTKNLLDTNNVLDRRGRAALFNRADAQMARDVPLIPLFQKPTMLAFRNNLRGVVDNASFESYTWNSEDWWLAP